MSLATPPTDYIHIIKEWEFEIHFWQQSLNELKKQSGGFINDQPQDIVQLEKRYNEFKKRNAKLANTNLEKKLLQYYSLHPSEQIIKHKQMKQLLHESIDTVVKKELTNKIKAILANKMNIVSIAVYDRNTEFEYYYNENYTYRGASTIKVYLLAALLYDAKLNSRNLTTTEHNLISPAITVSNNATTNRLWLHHNGKQKTERLVKVLGMNQTHPNFAFGLTETTVKDQLILMKHLGYPNNIFTDAQRNYALRLMANVVPSQKWGISGGVPKNVTVALKNGWSPKTGNNWRVNSFGHVKGQNRDYVISVMTINNPNMNYGVTTINQIAKVIWNHF